LFKTVFTEEDKKNLRAIAQELKDLRKLIEKLTETMVNINDKKLLESFQATQNDFNENKVLNYKETLQKQVDIAEKEIRSGN
jgi:glutamate synthase domain-containing protein 3